LIPHTFPFVSHAPLMQARIPFVGLHVPLTGASPGTGCPLGAFGTHVPAPLHQLPLPQLASIAHKKLIVSVAVFVPPIVATTVAVAVALPTAGGAVAAWVIVVLPPAAIEGKVQVRVWPARTQADPGAVVVPGVTPAGIAKVTVPPNVGLGPAFEMASV
jgi:hypothetical protein